MYKCYCDNCKKEITEKKDDNHIVIYCSHLLRSAKVSKILCFKCAVAIIGEDEIREKEEARARRKVIEGKL